MTFVHRWNGEYFGWIDHDDLYTNDGRHVGRLNGREIYGVKGGYVGELREHRLIASNAKAGRHWIGFIQNRIRMVSPATVKPMHLEPLNLPDGFDDFPSPDTL